MSLFSDSAYCRFSRRNSAAFVSDPLPLCVGRTVPVPSEWIPNKTEDKARSAGLRSGLLADQRRDLVPLDFAY